PSLKTMRSTLSISGLNERRRNIFRYTGVNAAPQFAVAHTIGEINREPDRKPDKEAAPRLERQAQHQREAEDHAEKRKDRHEGNTKRTRTFSIRSAQHNHTKANEHEGKNRADARTVSKRSDICQHRHATDGDSSPNGCDVWRAKPRVNFCEILRQQPVACHGHENAWLGELENEQH